MGESQLCHPQPDTNTPPHHIHHFFFSLFAGRIDPVIGSLQNALHMWAQPQQSDCIVEQAVEFIRKKLARRSTGSSPIGRSRGPLRLRAPQTFLWIIFSIPLLSSVRTDQIIAQGLHCEETSQKVLFSMPSLFFYASPLSLLPHTTKKSLRGKKKKIFPSYLLIKRNTKWLVFVKRSCRERYGSHSRPLFQ